MRGEIRHLHSGNDKENSHDATARRLAAIIVGDISGYSRLMQVDEDGTYARVKRIERDLIEPTIAEHHGRLVKTTGDGFIAIFDSPVEAVRCGIVIQQSMVGRNASLPREHWIVYRIGVNLGDVIIEDEDVYGDGVNVAARLEGIATPGQIFISGGIYEQVKHKLVCGYQSLGDRQVKNITDPVRVYRVLPDPSAMTENRMRPVIMLLAAATIALLVLAGGVLWYLLIRSDSQVASRPPVAVPPPADVAKAVPSPPAAPQAAPKTSVTAVAPAIKQQPSLQPTKEPEMVSLPGGSFAMGSNDDITEKPVHQVTVKPFAIGKYPVTVKEWNECTAAKACGFVAVDREDAPVTDVNWNDAKQFAAWLTQMTGKSYRIPSEAEWEYAARGGTQTKYWWGDQFRPGMVNCKNCIDGAVAQQPMAVASLKPNPFGLHDMGGGVDQWVEDCWNKNYQGAPSDGSAWLTGDCSARVIRSGSWRNDARSARPASRDRYDVAVRYPTHGFRVALSR
ncbi:MAG: SUMF1/EgtB/PvdO family nonheme iron enzyme [Afipia sp.]|nr:SUMF1/EgtB/PvdO family nonheme iron enzyme [Afipia sp.]